MFVQKNTLNATKQYFTEKLKERFSASEIRYMFQLLSEERLNKTHTELLLEGDTRLSESDLLYFRTAAHKLLDNVPFQHIIGYTYFYDLKIKCDSRALVPRPETEELVQWILEDYGHADTILDICTGTGCIALALKNKRAVTQVEGWDISLDALSLAKINATDLSLIVDFKQVDVLSASMAPQSWTVIVSNPPYIPVSEKQLMDKTVTEHDPDLALFVPDNDPLLFYRAIGNLAVNGLKDGGALYLEIHEDFGPQTVDLLESLGFKAELKQDMQGKDRMIKAVK